MDDQQELLSLACKRLRGNENQYERLASAWALELQGMDPTQALYAKNAINDIMFEGQMGTLHRETVVINQQPNPPSTSSRITIPSATNKCNMIPIVNLGSSDNSQQHHSLADYFSSFK